MDSMCRGRSQKQTSSHSQGGTRSAVAVGSAGELKSLLCQKRVRFSGRGVGTAVADWQVTSSRSKKKTG